LEEEVRKHGRKWVPDENLEVQYYGASLVGRRDWRSDQHWKSI